VSASLTIGRIAGIRIGVNWSWFVVFGLIAWSLAASIFPETNPGLSETAHVVMALIAAVLFYATLLAHELGHALQARREGMRIEGITLWLFGGVAQFRGPFPSAGAEFRIAIAGPLVSLALGAGLVLVAAFVPLPEGVEGVTAWLGYINLVLLVFNLLPALPLDGGRVLRSALWYFRRDFVAATRGAAAVAQTIAYGLIGLGLFSLFFVHSVSGVWLAFIGFFLLQAAAAESLDAILRQALAGRRVADLMAVDPVTVDADRRLDSFIDDVVWRARHTTYPVLDDGHPVGLLPFRAVAEVPRSEWSSRTVRDSMVPRDRVPVFKPEGALADAARVLGESELRRGLVVDDERLVGLLSLTDLMRALQVGPPPRARAESGSRDQSS
jgi:Zn-dependent protease